MRPRSTPSLTYVVPQSLFGTFARSGDIDGRAQTAAAFSPLFAGIPTQDRARQLKKRLAASMDQSAQSAAEAALKALMSAEKGS